jgi:hypothetical protein
MRVDGKLAFAVRDGTDTFVPKDFGCARISGPVARENGKTNSRTRPEIG